MNYLLLLATVSVAFAADEKADAQPKIKTAESAQPIRVHDGELRYRFDDGLELIRSRDGRRDNYRDSYQDNRRGPHRADYKDDDLPGPVVLRSPNPLPSHGNPDIERQNRIIADVYSPDYYQPTWILDYRYLKTGGRDYTRGPGGQVLILPKNVRTNEPKEFPDFDSLLEHLRLSRLSENSRRGGGGYRDDHDARRGYQNIGLGQYGRGQQQHEDNYDAKRVYQNIGLGQYGRGQQYGDDEDARRAYQNIGLGNYGRGQQQQQQNWWKGNRNH